MTQQPSKKYDYIIAGAGCAGLSLLYRMLLDKDLSSKEILVLDKEEKVNNDRTWCFWEKGAGVFEGLVTHEWKTLEFKNTAFAKRFNLTQYSYKMIRGIDFYEFVLSFAKNFKNVSFQYEDLTAIYAENDYAVVQTASTKYFAAYVFNSTSLFNPKITPNDSLLQHFEGWVIKTEQSTFDPAVGTLMDFSLDQKNGTTFMYVLPTSAHEALVEYTLFSEKLLSKNEYKAALEKYIKENLKIANYKILHTEFGVIPMSLAKFQRNPNGAKRVVNLGTAGGYTKASSGYTFQFIQKNTASIVANLALGQDPNQLKNFRDKRFEWYDRTLLEVLIAKKLTGEKVFSTLFGNVSPELILKFLANESSLLDDVMIMKSLPIKPFLQAGIKQLF